jgi:NSS family neurotransmitter:Na+ symporter
MTAGSNTRANFGSRLGIVLATAGSAVGLGNVWRFPYMTGQNGGAVFLIIYLGCVFLLGIPCMINEFIIGRHAQANTARAYTKLAHGGPWSAVGFLGVLTGFLITGYYAVVSGWCLQYIYASLMGHLKGDASYVGDYFTHFVTHPWKPIVCMLVFFAITHVVIVYGVQKGIERASKMLMPTLFILLLVIVVASCLLPGAGEGISFLFKPDFTKMNSDVFLGALGQSFYSMSLAMGCICTYASYFSRQTNLIQSAIQISLVDSIVAILAGLMIFPAAFSVGVSPDSGASLVFITLPNVFHQAFASMPTVGFVIALAFYALLSLAALTSLMSLHEVSTAFFHEELHVRRHWGALIVTLSCSVIGCFCSLSFSHSELSLFGMSLFDLFDFVTGQIFLPIGGFFTCLFLGWVIPRRIVNEEFTNDGTLHVPRWVFRTYLFCVRYLCPVCILLIFLNQLGVI